MNELNYVNDASLAQARSFEDRILKLPADAGIFFVSILPVPTTNGRSTHFVCTLGVSRKFEESAYRTLIDSLFKDEGWAEFTTRAFRGVKGPGRE